ncbi:YceI family protein [Streptomyces ficellus]|uniref:YceI family protein n=1 Tax=Streptomyces ficellus TaxID=1977088 RepID=UPI00338E42E0
MTTTSGPLTTSTWLGIPRAASGAGVWNDPALIPLWYGELTVCGVTHPIAVTLGTVAHEGKRMTASGTTTIDRYAFGITKAKDMTGRHLKITSEVVAHR